jgi:hypothetical protein
MPTWTFTVVFALIGRNFNPESVQKQAIIPVVYAVPVRAADLTARVTYL